MIKWTFVLWMSDWWEELEAGRERRRWRRWCVCACVCLPNFKQSCQVGPVARYRRNPGSASLKRGSPLSLSPRSSWDLVKNTWLFYLCFHGDLRRWGRWLNLTCDCEGRSNSLPIQFNYHYHLNITTDLNYHLTYLKSLLPPPHSAEHDYCWTH